ncbi:MAG: Nramp family divalent metal transporter [Bradymonadia bacterium]
MSSNPPRGLLRALGPGLLLAGAAVGVSHLVQSTRAGAVYGFALLWLVLLANVAKYPAFRFGPQYAAATGTSLLEGYRRQGKWALGVYGLLTVGTMFTVQGAVALVTAGLAKKALGLPGTPVVIAGGTMAVCAALLALGRYRWLDRINKVMVVALTLSTVTATALALPKLDFSALAFWPQGIEAKDLFFCAALVGWMPSAIDVAAWHSMWTLARSEDVGERPTVKAVLADFHLGYWGAAGLAVCFVILGAGVMHGSGVELANSAGGFAGQIIELYASTLGEWSRPMIGGCAFAVMFTTTFTVVDGFPRALAVLTERMRGPEQAWAPTKGDRRFNTAYWVSLAVLGAGSLAVITLFIGSLKAMVDLATILSCLTAPLLAWLNHRAILGDEVPPEHRPSKGLQIVSWAGITMLAAVAVGYLVLRLS